MQYFFKRVIMLSIHQLNFYPNYIAISITVYPSKFWIFISAPLCNKILTMTSQQCFTAIINKVFFSLQVWMLIKKGFLSSQVPSLSQSPSLAIKKGEIKYGCMSLSKLRGVWFQVLDWFKSWFESESRNINQGIKVDLFITA